MARETLYLVQSFTIGRGNRLTAEPPVSCKSADAARLKATRMADRVSGVVAFSTAADTELGEYDDQITVLFKAGSIPASFDDEGPNP